MLGKIMADIRDELATQQQHVLYVCVDYDINWLYIKLSPMYEQ